MVKVSLGTENDAKIEACRVALEEFYDNFDLRMFDVDGGIAQPMTAAESREGARNRARRAFEKSDSSIGIGIEGHAEPIDSEYYLSNFTAIHDGEHYWEGASGRAKLPKDFQERLKKRDELGDVILDEIGDNLSEKGGAIRVLTDGRIERAELTARSIVYALSDMEYSKNKS
ncbi:MAG: DUF84 family protein [Candidatus Nanohaloarchaea archaeon]